MRVFVAGGSGVIGRHLIPRLVTAGHDVIATTRREAKMELIARLGAEPVLMDALDRESVHRAVTAARPEAIIHELSSLSGVVNPKKMDEDFAETNKLRTLGTKNLMAAALDAGARRFVAQSYTGWNNARSGSEVKSEDDPLDANPPREARQTFAAIQELESIVTKTPDIEGIVVRYGQLYGPETGMGEGGELLQMVRQRKLPVVGNGAGVWSFVHIDDAARATLLALEQGKPGIYNIVDDAPAPVSEWLPYLAQALKAKRPWRLPVLLARPLLGELGISMMTQVRAASNAKAKRELGWQLTYPSWREGFRTGLG